MKNPKPRTKEKWIVNQYIVVVLQVNNKTWYFIVPTISRNTRQNIRLHTGTRWAYVNIGLLTH